MSEKTPLISGAQAVKAFCRAGWNINRQKGSHVMLTFTDRRVTLSVPQHKELARGTLSALIKDAGLTVAEFKRLL